MISHGNGLAADLYYPFWSRLVSGYDLIIHDLRNHGWNPVGPVENHSIPAFARDLDSILETVGRLFGPRPTVGVLHSVSALASLLPFGKGETLAARVLFDPPICKPGVSYAEFEAASGRAAEMARRRTERFKSMEDYAELQRFLPTFYRSVPGVIELLAATTLREREDGDGFALRCPPEHEARILDYSRIWASVVDFGDFDTPIKVIGADPTLPYSFLPTFDFNEIRLVDYDFIPETTHLLQLEKPGECVEMLDEFLGSVGMTNR